MDKFRKFTIVFSIVILSILQITYSYGNSQSLEKLFEKARQASNEEAIEIYQRIIREYPGTKDAARAQRGIGTRYFREKKYDLAIKAYQKCIDNYPEEEPERIALVYSTVADCYRQMFNFDMAKKTYEKIINKYPATKSAESAQKRLEQLNDPKYIEKFKMAKEYTEKMAPLNEANRYYKNKEYHQAITKAKELLTTQRDPEMLLYIRSFMADCYAKSNDKRQAIREYKKIIKLFPKTKVAKEAQERIKEIGGKRLPTLIALTLGILILVIIGVVVVIKRKKKTTT